MENEFEYYLDLKDFTPVYRWSIRWYFLGIILCALIALGFGAAVGLVILKNRTLGIILLVAATPFLVLSGIIGFKITQIRFTRYYGKGKITYNEDGTVTYQGDCGKGNPILLDDPIQVTKTFKPIMVKEYGNFWIIYLSRHEYIAVPKTVSIEPIKSLLVEKKKPRR